MKVNAFLFTKSIHVLIALLFVGSEISIGQQYITKNPQTLYRYPNLSKVTEVIVNPEECIVRIEFKSQKRNTNIGISSWTLLFSSPTQLLASTLDGLKAIQNMDIRYASIETRMEIFSNKSYNKIKRLNGSNQLDTWYSIKSKDENKTYQISMYFDKIPPGNEYITVFEPVTNGFIYHSIKINNPMQMRFENEPDGDLDVPIYKEEIISGTGFAISKDGYLATNSHVVDGGNIIQVKGVNGDFSRKYNAEVIANDNKNDLAIIKIVDDNFTSLGSLPFKLDNQISEVGTSIFVLGYPLRSTMGEEVKLTNGIISSKTGFQDDVSQYQISAPVQPGNSGGPLFDSEGNVIGIITAKHIGVENVSYAIKISYLFNLFDVLNEKINLPTTNVIADQSLPDQVKHVKEFVFIIDVIRN